MIVFDRSVKAFKIMFRGHTFKDFGKFVASGEVVGLVFVVTDSYRGTFRVTPQARKTLGQFCRGPFAKDNPERLVMHDRKVS
jgi:hypothetical protein